MSKKSVPFGSSAIEWTDATWNPVVGCTRHSAACDNCYAIRMSARQQGMNSGAKLAGTRPQYSGVVKQGDWTGVINAAPEHIWTKPLRTKKPTTYFSNSMSDLFHQNMEDKWIKRAFEIMNRCPQHNFQVLTKRPSRAVAATERLGLNWSDNIWFGASIGENKFAISFVRELLKVPAAIRFVSAEPLITALPDLDVSAVDWVIAGGESGPVSGDLRPADPDWLRDLRDRCAAAGTPFFFKQWGSHNALGEFVGKADAGHMLDGKEIWQMPASVFDRMSTINPRWTRVASSTVNRAKQGVVALRPYDRDLLRDGEFLLVEPEDGELGTVIATDDAVEHLVHKLGAASPDDAAMDNPNDQHHTRYSQAVLSALGEREQTVAELVRVTGLSGPTVATHARRLALAGKAIKTKDRPLSFAAMPSAQAIIQMRSQAEAMLQEATKLLASLAGV